MLHCMSKHKLLDVSFLFGLKVCRICLKQLSPKKCPFDNTQILRKIEELPVNFALLQLVSTYIIKCT